MEGNFIEKFQIYFQGFLLQVIVAFLLIFDVKESYCDGASNSRPNYDIYSLVPYMMDGFEVPLSSCPFVVAILLKWPHDYRFHCSGTLISDFFVITSGICMVQHGVTSPDNYRVIGGSVNVNDRKTMDLAHVKNIHIHPGYPADKSRDVALMELYHPLAYRINGHKRHFPKLNTESVDKKTCLICGYGAINKNKKFPVNLQAGWVTVHENYCPVKGEQGVDLMKLKDNMLCSNDFESSNPVISCRGDTGGPLYCGGKLSGLTSTFVITNKAECGSGEPHAKLDYFVSIRVLRDWIIKVMQEAEHPILIDEPPCFPPTQEEPSVTKDDPPLPPPFTFEDKLPSSVSPLPPPPFKDKPSNRHDKPSPPWHATSEQPPMDDNLPL